MISCLPILHFSKFGHKMAQSSALGVFFLPPPQKNKKGESVHFLSFFTFSFFRGVFFSQKIKSAGNEDFITDTFIVSFYDF